MAELSAEVDRLTESVEDAQSEQIRRQARAVSDDAGLVAETGEGVTVILSDAPGDDINAATVDLNRFVVHQQDIQSVVNALWSGGAQAVTVQGQRIISTTGIKCEGNSVTLQGVPYPQPYVISGIGDQKALLAALEMDADAGGLPRRRRRPGDRDRVGPVDAVGADRAGVRRPARPEPTPPSTARAASASGEHRRARDDRDQHDQQHRAHAQGLRQGPPGPGRVDDRDRDQQPAEEARRGGPARR